MVAFAGTFKFVLVAYASNRLKAALQILVNGLARIADCTGNDLNIFFVKNVDGAAADSSGYDRIRSQIIQEIRQKPRLMAWVLVELGTGNFTIFSCKKLKALTMTKVFRNILTVTCNCNFHKNQSPFNYN